MKFKDLKFEDRSETHGENAVQAWVDFPNGYSASVVRHIGSYGHKQGLYEIGVFYGESLYAPLRMVDPLDWHDTVKGYLHEDAVTDILEQLQKLEN